MLYFLLFESSKIFAFLNGKVSRYERETRYLSVLKETFLDAFDRYRGFSSYVCMPLTNIEVFSLTSGYILFEFKVQLIRNAC